MDRIKVLLIDDEEEFCRVLKLSLEQMRKFDVLTASRGDAGLDLAKSRKPDIILLDIVMPGMSGTEVAEQLREDSETCQIPIIFLTAVLQKGEEGGFGGSTSKYRIIAKPVKVDELIRQIKDAVTA